MPSYVSEVSGWTPSGYDLVAAADEALAEGDQETAARLIDAAFLWFEERDLERSGESPVKRRRKTG